MVIQHVWSNHVPGEALSLSKLSIM